MFAIIKSQAPIISHFTPPQTKLGKFIWCLIVCISFTVAAYLINKSYVSWQKSPVATSVTTKSISDLDFPTVTVCPAKGSNTALNYDLMMADNDSLTEQNRDDLKNGVYENIIEKPHQENIQRMLAIANPTNARQMYDGFQTTPQAGQRILMWNNNGSIQTPWFGEEYNEDFYIKDRQHHMILQFPENLAEQVGTESLVIQLEVDTREEEGWKEEVSYSLGSRFHKFFKQTKTWADAESFCKSKGGHLASLRTESDAKDMKDDIGNIVGWIGGSDQEEEGVWKWSDGSSWRFANWRSGFGENRQEDNGKGKNCAARLGDDTWMDKRCNVKLPFICTLETIVRGKANLSFEYGKDQLTSSFQVRYYYEATNQTLLESWRDKRMTGFRMSWKIENPPLEMTTSEIGKSVQTPGLLNDELFDRGSYMADRAFKSTLVLSDNVTDQVGDGSLVIELNVVLRENGKQSEEYPKKYKLYRRRKTWRSAEAFCTSEGGNLASIQTEKE